MRTARCQGGFAAGFIQHSHLWRLSSCMRREGGSQMQSVRLVLVLLLTVVLGGCELAGDIFQAGFAIGVVAVVIIVIALFVLVKKLL
jgi:hypothetical protein